MSFGLMVAGVGGGGDGSSVSVLDVPSLPPFPFLAAVFLMTDASRSFAICVVFAVVFCFSFFVGS